MKSMGMLTGLLIAISLGLLGAFFCIRLAIRSLRLSRRLASWPERNRQMAASRRYFGLALLLLVMIVIGVVMFNHHKIAEPVVPSNPSASPQRTATRLPSATRTNSPSMTSTPVPTEVPTLTSKVPQSGTPVLTLPWVPLPSETPLPTDTRWPTWTPSLTPPASATPMPSLFPSRTATPLPTWTPLPTDTRWPSLSPTATK